MRLSIVAIILFISFCRAEGQVLVTGSVPYSCADGNVAVFRSSVNGFRCEAQTGGGGGVSAGLITFIVTGTCPTGWTEVAALNGVVLRGTLAANADVGTTGGNDTITPTVNSLTAAAQVITWPVAVPINGVTGSESAHTHPVGTYINGTSAVSGIVVDAHASHTHTYTDIIAHTHTENGPSAATGPLVGWTPDTSTNTSTASGYLTASTGVASGTTAGPSASLTHNVSNNGTAAAQILSGSSGVGTSHNHTGSTITWPVAVPTNGSSAVTGTLNSFSNIPAFEKVIFCSKD